MELTLLIATILFTSCKLCSSQGLPTVDLGYEIHQAISLDTSGQFYNFSNIRFALPPIGNLRWAAPQAPTGRDTVIQNGSVGRICPQANPAWLTVGFANLPNVAAGNATDFNTSLVQQTIQSTPPGTFLFDSARNGKLPPQDPRTTEDCLFLDVVVSKSVFDRAQNGTQKSGAPVMAWIYGGGYTIGEKASGNDVHGLMKIASQKDGLVFVAMNYRLGAFGFLSGPTLQAAAGVSNAGLLDQRFALEWIQKYIHLFGGDPSRVTITGESAGGGSVTFQLTAFGGQKSAPFQQAMPQSPGFMPFASTFIQENTTQAFLKMINASSIAEARQTPSDDLIRANAFQIAASNWGEFTYGPVVDGIFAPAMPGNLFLSGSFAPNISVLSSRCRNEGALFTPPYMKTEQDMEAWLEADFPLAADSVRHDLAFTCNLDFINKAYPRAYAYEFQIGPSFHGCDPLYNFYAGQPTNASTGLIAPYAQQLQEYQINFITRGDPNGPGLPLWSVQGKNASSSVLTVNGWGTMKSPDRNMRCTWWQKGLTF